MRAVTTLSCSACKHLHSIEQTSSTQSSE